MRFLYLLIFSTTPFFALFAQTKKDTSDRVELDSVLIRYQLKQPDIKRLEQIKGTFILNGKKNEVIQVTSLDANIAVKTARQIFAKVPGLFVYDMDGSGNQINISTRGLDAHRGWEFNIRKDGIITNSDMYGYPASHYSMPLESIDHIDLVRGTGSLQYGAQFGGMLNYVSKTADTTRTFSFETINSAGSYNLLSTYNAIGGRVGKLTYYAYLYKRSSDGYRDEAQSRADAEMVTLNFAATKDISIKAEWARSYYRYRTPGPLTDAEFAADPRQASRTRNYFSPAIHVPSLRFDWRITPGSRISLVSSAVIGQRSSVQFDKPTNIRDTIVTATGQYNNRQVDIDNFNSYTTELRFLQQYTLLNDLTSTLTVGTQYMNNDLQRRQLGVGTNGSDYDLTLVQPEFGRNLHFRTKNIAVFAENTFQLTDAFSVNLGARVESGQSAMRGTIAYLPENEVPNTIRHRFPLFGGSFQYQLNGRQNLYGGISQAYRPVIFKDIIPGSAFERADKNLLDAKGYNLEAGYRGSWQFLQWDISYFRLGYDNRLGNTVIENPPGTFIIYKSNIGNSVTNGAELFLQGNFTLSRKLYLTMFTSTSYMAARYTDAAVRSENAVVHVDGNDVESVPHWISRNGITLKFPRLSFSTLYSYTSDSYADALNTLLPSATGAVGRVPGYGLLDANATFSAWRNVQVKFGLNNITNEQYFTKRPTFYPGAGVWPSDGRNFNVSVGIKI